jgi:hypothetical protein
VCIIVTGPSGKLGRATVAELLAHGHEVWNVDQAPPREAAGRFTKVDLTDFGQVCELLRGIDEGWDSIDGVVHLAAIPGPPRPQRRALRQQHPGQLQRPRRCAPCRHHERRTRRGAQAVRLALEHDATGMDVFIIASADTVMSRSSSALVAEVFPDVPVRRALRSTRRWCRSTRRGGSAAVSRPTAGGTRSGAGADRWRGWRGWR